MWIAHQKHPSEQGPLQLSLQGARQALNQFIPLLANVAGQSRRSLYPHLATSCCDDGTSIEGGSAAKGAKVQGFATQLHCSLGKLAIVSPACIIRIVPNRHIRIDQRSNPLRTVLLVEDSLTEAEVLSQYLKQAYLGVIKVSSSEEAQSALKSHRPDLVVLDVILPGQSGFEFCRDLKTDPATKDIPVVMCSTKGTDADKLWGSMVGADAYVPKPVDGKEFVSTVRQLLPA